MQSEDMSFQSAFERGQCLGCSDVHRKVIPPSLGPEQIAVVNGICRCDGRGSRGSAVFQTKCPNGEEMLSE